MDGRTAMVPNACAAHQRANGGPTAPRRTAQATPDAKDPAIDAALARRREPKKPPEAPKPLIPLGNSSP